MQDFQNKPVAAGALAGATRFTASYHSKLSNKIIFPQPGLLYSLVIFENNVLFRKTI
jgi:hypothetical protein